MSIDAVAKSARAKGALVPVAAAILQRALPQTSMAGLVAANPESRNHFSGTGELAAPPTLLVAQLFGSAAREQAPIPAARAMAHYDTALTLARPWRFDASIRA